MVRTSRVRARPIPSNRSLRSMLEEVAREAKHRFALEKCEEQRQKLEHMQRNAAELRNMRLFLREVLRRNCEFDEQPQPAAVEAEPAPARALDAQFSEVAAVEMEHQHQHDEDECADGSCAHDHGSQEDLRPVAVSMSADVITTDAPFASVAEEVITGVNVETIMAEDDEDDAVAQRKLGSTPLPQSMECLVVAHKHSRSECLLSGNSLCPHDLLSGGGHADRASNISSLLSMPTDAVSIISPAKVDVVNDVTAGHAAYPSIASVCASEIAGITGSVHSSADEHEQPHPVAVETVQPAEEASVTVVPQAADVSAEYAPMDVDMEEVPAADEQTAHHEPGSVAAERDPLAIALSVDDSTAEPGAEAPHAEST
jgi:hypothetical protein